MKRILTLALAAGMIFGAATGARAIDFKASGEWLFGLGAGDGSLLKKNTDRTPADSDDIFNAGQRIRLQLDAVASESLSGTVFFEIGDQFWGRQAEGAALGADGNNVIKVKNAYLDWLVPTTDLRFRMGLQAIAMPNVAGGSAIMDGDAAGIVASYQFNENVGLTALWMRPLNDNYAAGDWARRTGFGGRNQNLNDSNYLDNMDLFALTLPLKFDGVELTPWAMLGFQGRNSRFNQFGVVTEDGALDFTLGSYYPGFNFVQGNDVNGSPYNWTSKAYGSMFWAGLPVAITLWEPLNIEFDINYGYVEGMGNYYVNKQYNGFQNGIPYSRLVKGNTQRQGWLVKALVEYKMDWGTPGIFGWYASGDDGNVKNGSERLPSIAGAGNFTSFIGDGNLAWGTLGTGGYDMNLTYAGTWGIGFQLADMSFVEDLRHTFRVAYWGGTNSPSMTKYMDNAASWNVGAYNQDGPYLTTNDGLCSNQFNYKSGYRSREGIIYFGCIEGLISFDPKSLSKGYDGYLPPIYITDFSLLDSKTPIGEKNSPLLKSCIYCDSIRLRYNQNSFSLQLAVLGYRNPAAYRPIYKLEGFDDQWRQIPQNGSTVSYSKLRPGKYLFRAQVTNGEEIGERTLYVRITPPFYRSKAAYFIYILLMASVIYLATTYQDRRHKRREWQRIRAFEQEKEREMYNGKIKFFTDITHEIRTPLTLIKVPLENILKKKEVNKELIDDLNIMNRNTNRLLDLTNQLLDFQKIEKERMTLNLVRQNVAAIVEETCYRFSSTVKQQGKSFGLAIDADKDTMWADIDKEAFTKVISNLLLNALKYSESRIRVHMSGANGSLRLTVVNDGEVVPKEVREKIFTPFFQHAHKSEFTGSGIGLSLSRSLIELQHGTLVMGPSETENEFILTIPLSVEEGESQLAEYDDMIPEAPDTAQSLAGETYTILVVEDHAEMRTYIHRMLSEHYTVITANDGLEALEQLDSKHINLIITDIMMPRMDGIELCERVKNDLKFSHIPLILLTAKTNLQSKIQGMETGADVYIEKPFSADYLLSVIANLIKGRQTLYESFTKNPLVMASRMATSQVDMDFIRRLQEIIHANFNNPEFKPNEIAKMMHMSRASFYRKVKGVLDVTPNDYIQIERLKTAAQLLKEGKYHINEVCYMVGFSSPSYFAKCFQRQFGMLPKQFAADKGEQEQPTDDKNP